MRTVPVLCSLLLLAMSNRALADTFGTGGNTFNIDFVTIGNPGNAPDTTGNPNPAGAVPYAFNLGKYEVSRDMIIKANSLGALGITLANLNQNGGNGVNRPATGISWNEAARFIDWLNTSTGYPPAYKFAIQPGGTGYSANAEIASWTANDPGYNPNNVYRNRLARYFLPSVDEWFKGAYYDPNDGVYYDSAIGSDSEPVSVSSGTEAGTAVLKLATAQGPADITQAGGLSSYGTMAQNGNAAEWEESAFDVVNGPVAFMETHAVRGGSWSNFGTEWKSTDRLAEAPSLEFTNVGFRIASTVVPEPSALLLAITAFATLLTRRRKSVPHNRV